MLSTPRARLPAIDTLRGISILLVVIHHIGLRIRLNKTALSAFVPGWILSGLNWSGYEAVFVFFVISGFLIATNTIERWGSLSRVRPRAFYARRFARIVPCLALLVAVLSALHFLHLRDYLIDKPAQSLGRAVLAVIGLHLNWYEGHTGYLPGGWDVLWSLSIEEAFYLAFPLVCLAVRSEKLLALGLGALALSLPITHAALEGNEIWQEKAWLPGMAAIATGVLAAMAVQRLGSLRRGYVLAGFAAGAFGLGFVIFGESILWKVLKDSTMLILTFSSAVLVICGHAASRLQMREWPGLGWLRAWGRRSYELYLCHMFVVFAAVRFFQAHDWPMWRGWLVFPPALLATWLLGWAIARFISDPADRRLRAALLDRPGEGGRAPNLYTTTVE